MRLRNKSINGYIWVILVLTLTSCQERKLEIASGQLEIGWHKCEEGWKVDRVKIKTGDE